MRKTLCISLLLAVLVGVPAGAGAANEWDGTVKLGWILVDETGDKSAVQETYNLYDGFNLTQLKLRGDLNNKTSIYFDLRETNLDSRRGRLEIRVPSMLKFTTQFSQHRQVFDPDRVTTTMRKNWRFGLDITPQRWLKIFSNYNYTTRAGDRLPYPTGTESWLGDGYDYQLHTGRVEAQFSKGPQNMAFSYDFSDFTDEASANLTDRKGGVFAGRIYIPNFKTDKIAHQFRGAFGRSELKNGGVDFNFSSFKYAAIIDMIEPLRLDYRFFARRVDNKSTKLQTDNFRNDIDATLRSDLGWLLAGYGYEANDDDHHLTSYNTFRGEGVLRKPEWVKLHLRYVHRTKDDVEKRTLLQEIETATFMGKADFKVGERGTVGGRYMNRSRELTDLNVKIDGQQANVYGRYNANYADVAMVGAMSTTVTADYTYALDELGDRIGSFDTESHFVTARIDLDFRDALRLGAGFNYLDVGKDLDIEKSGVLLDAEYTFQERYHLEVRYNVYNYDDYLLIDRYYTANVVWIDLGYDFSVK